jgi:hypothetical protein
MLASNLEVLANPDTEQKLPLTEVLEPLVTNKLPVSHQTSDTTPTKRGNELLQQGDPFGGVGVTLLIQKVPVDREGNAIIDNRQHQQVDGILTKQPIRPIQAQSIPLDWLGQQGHYQFGNDIVVQFKLGKKRCKRR